MFGEDSRSASTNEYFVVEEQILIRRRGLLQKHQLQGFADVDATSPGVFGRRALYLYHCAWVWVLRSVEQSCLTHRTAPGHALKWRDAIDTASDTLGERRAATTTLYNFSSLSNARTNLAIVLFPRVVYSFVRDLCPPGPGQKCVTHSA